MAYKGGGRDLPSDWARRRRLVLERDNWTCQLCRRRAPGNPPRSPSDHRGVLEVDHVGDPDDHRLEVLRTLCWRCHARRTSAQGNTSARRFRRRRDPERHPGLK